MKNVILNFEKDDIELNIDGENKVYEVQDYFSKDIKVYNLKKELSDYILKTKLYENDKIERLAYELYGNTDYWDILVTLNSLDPLFNMYYDFDIIDAGIAKYVEDYDEFYYDKDILPKDRYNKLYEEYLKKALEENKKYEYIYIIRPTDMPKVITILKNKGFI